MSLPASVYLDSLNHLGHLHFGLSLHWFPIHACDFIACCQCPFQSCRGVIKDLWDNSHHIKKVPQTQARHSSSDLIKRSSTSISSALTGTQHMFLCYINTASIKCSVPTWTMYRQGQYCAPPPMLIPIRLLASFFRHTVPGTVGIPLWRRNHVTLRFTAFS